MGVWVGWLWLGMRLIEAVIQQHVPGYPTIGQIDFLIGIPLKIVAILLLAIAGASAFTRLSLALVIVATLALFGVLPYVFFYGGGV